VALPAASEYDSYISGCHPGIQVSDRLLTILLMEILREAA